MEEAGRQKVDAAESGDTLPGRGNALSTLPKAGNVCLATFLARDFTAKNTEESRCVFSAPTLERSYG